MAASQQRRVAFATVVVVVLVTCEACPPYRSIFSFGDSLADTGNLYFSSQNPSQHCFFPPYGNTFFHHPSGRCSDGRLIIDFIAESLGLPLVKPYMGIKYGGLGNCSVDEGANFAVIGATALDSTFFEDKGITFGTNYSLSVQLNWFKDFLPSLCNSSSSCQQVLGNSLFLAGEIGGNDFNYPFFDRRSISEVKSYVPHVINAITSLITELIDLGGRTFIVPGNLPLGCSAIYLTEYETQDKNEYDSAGCLKWLNQFAQYYNQNLQTEIVRLRGLHPHSNIIYADYYNAALPFFTDPTKFGFKGLKICCGMGGPYNYNSSAVCGDPRVKACEDPSQYIGWDGVHLTEAAYKLIAEALLNGPYSLPNFATLCYNNQKALDLSITATFFHEMNVNYI